MQIILALIIGAVVGLAVHDLAGGRATRGAALAPMIGAFLAGLVWTILTWAGLGLDSAWLWLSPLVVSWLAWPVVAFLAHTRHAHDLEERKRLRIV
jgi:fatty acid desaturase